MDISISIPEGLRSWIDTRLAEGRYASAGDYLRDLIERDQQDVLHHTEWLQAELDKGRASPILDRDPYQVVEDVVARYRAKRGQA